MFTKWIVHDSRFKKHIMKRLLLILIIALFSISAYAQEPVFKPIGTEFSYSNSGNDFWFYLYSEFAFGSGGGGGPKITGFLEQRSNDTMYLKALYNTEGVWAGWYSYSMDTIAYTRTDMAIRYFNISINIYLYNEETGTKTDTAWNERDTTFSVNPTGLSQVQESSGVSIFPNPSNGAFTIANTAVVLTAAQRNSWPPPGVDGPLRAILYDLTGRVVQQQTITFSNNTASLKTDAGSGVYFLLLSDEAGNTIRERIVIE
jgi:hypothetical protein